MKERPILFGAPMVRAILDGRKSQTRRIVNPQPPAECEYAINGAGDHALCFAVGTGHSSSPVCVPPTARSKDHRLPCPYGVPGDRLWVRETWRTGVALDDKSPARIAAMATEAGYVKPWAPIRYEADGHEENGGELRVGDSGGNFGGAWGKTRVAIHLPRWASRITLEVTDVRVQRVQDITEEDARAEGVEPTEHTARDMFAALWTLINGKRAPWASNPWVWAVAFKRVEGGSR